MAPSLYANLLNKANANASASSPAVISSEPVKYSFKKAEDEAKEEKKAADAALRFQPVKRRPQVQQQKAKPRAGPVPTSSSQDKQLLPTERKAPSAPASGTGAGESIENWIDEDADDYYVAEYTRHKQAEKERQKEAKKKRKKKSHQHETREVDWNAIYDPEQPVRLGDYKGSLEELDAKHEWKQRLHAHERKKNKPSPVPEPETRASSELQQDSKFRAFAPPSSYDFAPPSQQRQQQSQQEDDDDDYAPPPALDRASHPSGPDAPLDQGHNRDHGHHRNQARNQDQGHNQDQNWNRDRDEDEDYEPPPAVPDANISHHTGTAQYINRTQPPPPPPQVPLTFPPPQSPGLAYAPSPVQGMQYPPPLPPPPPPLHAQGLHYPPPPPPGVQYPPGPWQLPPGVLPPPPPGMPYPILPQGMHIPPPPPFAQAQPSPPPTTAPPTSTPAAAPIPPTQQSSGAVISRAPVRFNQPPPNPNEENDPQVGGLGFEGPSDPTDTTPEPEDDAPRSKAPGQKGFAKRLLQRYGWKEGQGLGASGDGITTILQHQTQKRKKKPDSEGGGWAGNAAMGRIVGGKKRKVEGTSGDGNASADEQWSMIARFEGMLQGLDLDAEIGEGSLMQDLGEKMAEYGHVERLFIFREGKAMAETGAVVFVKFTSALSAYRAVQAAQANDFLGNGRVVRSGFWDEEKFSQDVYE